MPANNLQEFVKELRGGGDLVDVRESVSAKFEITEISDRVMKRTGPATTSRVATTLSLSTPSARRSGWREPWASRT